MDPGLDLATRRLRAEELRACRQLARADTANDCLRDGCASLGEYGERFLGLSPAQTRILARVGHVLESEPRLTKWFVRRRITLEQLAAYYKILCVANRPDEVDWERLLVTTDTRDFCWLVAYFLEKWRIGREPVHVAFWLSPDGLKAFRRARLVASQREGRHLSEGEALELLAEEWLGRNDPIRHPGAPRRLEDTTLLPQSRYIPAEVRRQVIRRDNGRCAVPGCDHTLGLNFAHVVAHAAGGNRERSNILLLCTRHNQLMEMGALHILGTADDPIFVERSGRVHLPSLYAWGQGPTVEDWLKERGHMQASRSSPEESTSEPLTPAEARDHRRFERLSMGGSDDRSPLAGHETDDVAGDDMAGDDVPVADGDIDDRGEADGEAGLDAGGDPTESAPVGAAPTGQVDDVGSLGSRARPPGHTGRDPTSPPGPSGATTRSPSPAPPVTLPPPTGLPDDALPDGALPDEAVDCGQETEEQDGWP